MRRTVLTLFFLLCAFLSNAQLQIGSIPPEIALPGVKDSIVKLSSLSGKVVLIDFWASWCAPCRAANPYIEKLYKKYKAQGFEVYAVSIDVKKEAWLKAIKKDKLTYTQVIENTGWYSKVAEQYYVDQLPTNFLLDKEGKIAAINLEGKALFDKVKTLVQ